MQLPAVLEKRWLAVTRLARRTLTIDADGIELGKTLLAPFREGELVIDEARIAALLSTAFGYAVPAAVVESFRHAGRCYKSGDHVLAQMHLALCGIQIIDLEKAQRLFVADWALNNHVSRDQLLKLAGVEKYNHNHLGPGPNGGQFAPKDSGSATMTLHDAISQDAGSNASNVSAAVQSASNLAISNATIAALDVRFPHEALDSDPIGGILLPAAAAYGAAEFIGSEAAATIAARAKDMLNNLSMTASGMGAAAAEKVEELYDSLKDTIDEWMGENGKINITDIYENDVEPPISENNAQISLTPDSWQDPDTFSKHFLKHGQDFNSISPEDYADKAGKFLEKAKQEKLPMIEYPNGSEISTYEPETNTFGLYNANGKTISFYKPTSPTYFTRQIQRVLNTGGKIINPIPSR